MQRPALAGGAVPPPRLKDAAMADHAPRYQLPPGPGVQARKDASNIYRAGGAFHAVQLDIGRRGSTVVKDARGPTGVLHLTGLRTLRHADAVVFIDGRETFDREDAAAHVMRLYRIVLGRVADQSGLATHVPALEAGTAPDKVAEALLGSAEFTTRHGKTLGHQDFVNALYRNMRGSVPLAVETAGWVSQLQAGTLTRGGLAVGIANSAEHRDATAPILAQGIWVRDESAIRIANLWRAAFDRLPSRDGLARWVSRVHAEALPLGTVAGALYEEAGEALAGLDDAAFIQALHQNTLGRDAEPGTLEAWQRHLRPGAMSRPEMMLFIADSAAVRKATAPLFEADAPGSYGITLVN
jgi:hypothetical protein